MTSNYPFRNTFLTQLTSINIRSTEFPNTVIKMLASQEGMNAAMSLQGDDASTLVEILDQAFEAPDMALDLRRRSVRTLREVCCSWSILPRSCILSGNITKEGDTVAASGRFADVWKGLHNGNRVCVKTFRTRTTRGSSKIRRRLFQETTVWRRLSHPNVLPVLGVTPKFFPLRVVTEWMINGNIMDFTHKHPEVNRLYLLAEAAQGLQYLHSIRIIHGHLKPENVLIDHDCHPRLTDYGLPLRLDVVEGGSRRYDDLQYLAPELLDPHSFGLKSRIPTKESDAFSFGMVIYQVLTEQEPFPGAKPSIMANVVTGTRPHRPPGSDEWLSDGVWDFINRCWLASWNDRPDVGFVANVLNDAGDVVEFRRKEPDLVAFLDASKTGVWGGPEVKKAQELVDMIDSALENGNFTKRSRKQYMKHLRKLCSIFGILPSSFTLAQMPDKCEATPFDSGGSSDVYKATLEGRPVVIKTLKANSAANPKKAHKVLIKEVVGWKWLRHENILPFVGVMFTPPLISIVSERMENGNIVEFVRVHPKYNRLSLLADAAAGLKYLHGYDIVHGDLKGANILIDSNRRARLADFGLAVVADESTVGATSNHRGVGGTIRWMAPEVMYPEKFGFAGGKYRKRLPSKSTDIYALGMTILEVMTGCRPFDSIARDAAVMYKVLEGGRPDRPPSGFSDQLWRLLVCSWSVEHDSKSSKRPSATTVRDQLREDARNWGQSVVPLTLIRSQNGHGCPMDLGDSAIYTVSRQLEDDAPENTQTAAVAHPTPSPLPPPQARPKKARIANKSVTKLVDDSAYAQDGSTEHVSS